MVREVSGLGSPPVNDLRADRNGQSRQVTQQSTSTSAENVQTAAAPVEQVDLSRQAQQLKALETQLAQQPDVDEQRVADIRARLDSGDFSIDNLALADNILNTEALFGK